MVATILNSTLRNFILLILLLIFSSCATIITRKEYNINISTNLPNAKAEILDSIYNLPADFNIKRSKEDLKIKLICDTLEKVFLVKASPNAAFLYGNLILYPIFPITFGIDLTNQKRFYYGKEIFLDSQDTSGIIRPKIYQNYYDYWTKSFPTKKGHIYLTCSFPWVNSFYLQPTLETPKMNTGFIGFSAGLEYFYRDNKYISLSGSTVMDFIIPVPASVSFSGEVENMYSVYTSLSDNHRFRRFSIAYGISFSRNTWELVYYDRYDPPPSTREQVTKTSNSLGLTFGGSHQVGKLFNIGLIYRPTILTVYPDFSLKYEHLVSLEFKWKIRVKK
ncbi:MAG: hypothetical protein JXR36_12335 [Bacteroidales bacterium]|nr:hypothetical protein [Bacteroidales bacterium]